VKRAKAHLAGSGPARFGVPPTVLPGVTGTVSAMVECPKCERWAYVREPGKPWEHGVHVASRVECRCGETMTVEVRMTREEQ
jgi:hypothetical protein